MRWLCRWLMLCPERRDQKRRPLEPSEFEINSIRNDKQKLATVRSRCQMHSFTVSRIRRRTKLHLQPCPQMVSDASIEFPILL